MRWDGGVVPLPLPRGCAQSPSFPRQPRHSRDTPVIPATATSFPRTREPRAKQTTPLPRKRTGPTKAARGKRLFLCLWIPASAGMTGGGGEILPFAKRRGGTGGGGGEILPFALRRGRERAKRISQGMHAEGMGSSSSKTTYTPHLPEHPPLASLRLLAPPSQSEGGERAEAAEKSSPSQSEGGDERSGGEILPFALRRGRERAKRISQGMHAEGRGSSSSKTTYTPHHPEHPPLASLRLLAPPSQSEGGATPSINAVPQQHNTPIIPILQNHSHHSSKTAPVLLRAPFLFFLIPSPLMSKGELKGV